MSSPNKRGRQIRAGLSALLLFAVPLTFASLAGGPIPPPSLGTSGVNAFSTSPTLECKLPPLAVDSVQCASALLMEVRTGAVLFEHQPDSVRAPASLAKMMLEILVLEDLAAGRFHVEDSVRVSESAASLGGATVEILPGECVALGELLNAVVIVSANDAALALAEHLEAGEEAFVARMNARAAQLGCTSTYFANCHGLDTPPQESTSTARDIAFLARHLLALPGALEHSSRREMMFREILPMKSTNELLGVMDGVDGLKTGLTSKAGSCFCGTIERDGVRFVSVVLGAAPGPSRFEITRLLFERAFDLAPRWVPAQDEHGFPRVQLAASSETR